MVKSYLISIFILLCAVIIESSILSNLSFLLAVPDIVLICSIYFSLLNGKLYGETCGFVSGIFLDWSTGIPFGFNSLIRTIVSYVFGFFSETIILKGILMPMVAVASGTVLKAVLKQLSVFFFPNVGIYLTHIISYEFLFELVINTLLAPFFFNFLNLFIRSLSISSTKDKVDNV